MRAGHLELIVQLSGSPAEWTVSFLLPRGSVDLEVWTVLITLFWSKEELCVAWEKDRIYQLHQAVVPDHK